MYNLCIFDPVQPSPLAIHRALVCVRNDPVQPSPLAIHQALVCMRNDPGPLCVKKIGITIMDTNNLTSVDVEKNALLRSLVTNAVAVNHHSDIIILVRLTSVYW